MKKCIGIYMVMMVSVLLFSACASKDGLYNTAKGVYKAGKAAYKMTGNESDSLKALDNAAKSYDQTRTAVRDIQDEKKPDATISPALMK
jgi:hypothetical protein